MNPLRRRLEKTQYNYWFILFLAAGSLLATLALGLASGLVTAWPESFSRIATLRTLQPLHTTLALAWLFLGCISLVGLYAADGGLAALRVSRAQVIASLLFLTGAAGGIAQGRYSGREYLAWPVVASAPLLVSFLLNLATAFRARRKMAGHSAEAAWLILAGSILLPASLVEGHLFLLDPVAADPGRDLTIQWHALDSLMAAWIVVLYGIGMLLLPPGSKPARGGWLFLLAAIGILLDFGHHNYSSPQPHLIKLISFTATMLGSVSFLRHLRAARRRMPGADALTACMRQVEVWTLVAVGSGILLAVPQINLYAHGTYAIPAHAMGSVIGVNSSLILIAGYCWAGRAANLRPAHLRWNGIALALFCATLTGLGLAEGALRIDRDFLAWNASLRPFHLLIPLTGLPLFGTLAWLGAGLARCVFSRLACLTADDLAAALPDLRPSGGKPPGEYSPAATAALQSRAGAPPDAGNFGGRRDADNGVS